MSNNSTCPYCKIDMVAQEGGFADLHICEKCGHRMTNGYLVAICDCENCKAVKLKEERKKEKSKANKLELLAKFNESETDLPTKIEERVALLAMLFYLKHDEKEVFDKATSLQDNQFSPTGDFTNSLLNSLFQNHIINIYACEYNLDYIDIEKTENGLSIKYNKSNLKKIHFSLNSYLVRLSELEELLLKIEKHPLLEEELLSFWKKIAHEELVEYLYYLFDEFNINNEYVGDAVIESVRSILNNFSVSQGMAILYTCVKDVIAFRSKRGVSLKHAINTIPTYIENAVAKRLTGEWNAKEFSRNYELPQSAISITFFDRILKIGNKGFTCKPAISHFAHITEDLEEKVPKKKKSIKFVQDLIKSELKFLKELLADDVIDELEFEHKEEILLKIWKEIK